MKKMNEFINKNVEVVLNNNFTLKGILLPKYSIGFIKFKESDIKEIKVII